MKAHFVAGMLLAACASPVRETGLERDLQRTAQLARMAFDQGELEKARSQFRRVLDLAHLTDDSLAIGNAAYNLALLHAEAGEFEAAELFLSDSEAALLRAGEPLADPRLLRAKCAWLRGDAEACKRGLESALDAADARPLAEHRFEVMLLQGQLAADRGDAVNAMVALDAAKKLDREGPEAAEEPTWIALAGRVEILQGRPRAAADLFDTEAEIQKRSRNFRRMTQALVRAAEAFVEAKEWALAADRLVRASQMRLAAGDTDEAVVFAGWAKHVAVLSAAPELAARVANLERAIGKPVESHPTGSRAK